MLKIDVIKFESQDVVTTSIPTPAPISYSCECNMTCEYTSEASIYVYHGGCNNSCKADSHPKAKNYNMYG